MPHIFPFMNILLVYILKSIHLYYVLYRNKNMDELLLETLITFNVKATRVAYTCIILFHFTVFRGNCNPQSNSGGRSKTIPILELENELQKVFLPTN